MIRAQVIGFWQDMADEDWSSACGRLSLDGWRGVVSRAVEDRQEARAAPTRDDCVEHAPAVAKGLVKLDIAKDDEALRVRRIRLDDPRTDIDATADLVVAELPDRHHLVPVGKEWQISLFGWLLRD